jgi:hypothetical protein
VVAAAAVAERPEVEAVAEGQEEAQEVEAEQVAAAVAPSRGGSDLQPPRT